MFDSSVSIRLQIMCQKYGARRDEPSCVRTPYTTSASPRARGARSPSQSPGSYSRSASWITTNSRLASAKPRRTAAPLPRFSGCSRTRTRGSSYWDSRRRVPSVEPSSTTISSPVKRLPSTLETISSMVTTSL